MMATEAHETLASPLPSGPALDTLSKEQMRLIDVYLLRTRLNLYGEHPFTVCPQGTPLRDPHSGLVRDRHEYVLSNLPELWTILGLSAADVVTARAHPSSCAARCTSAFPPTAEPTQSWRKPSTWCMSDCIAAG